MKFLNKITFFLLLSIMVSCDRCKREDPNIIDTTKLPPATITGENTMGCLINGEVWLPLKENFLGNLVYDIRFEVSPLSQGGGVFIQPKRSYNGFNERLNIGAADVVESNTYPFSFIEHKYINHLSECGHYNLDTTYNNFINITRIDFNYEILSGSFEMRVVNEECDTLTITEGRFDLSGN